MTYIPQGTSLTCKKEVSFKVGNKGRVITIKKGHKCWVTNSQTDQAKGHITIDREGRGIISHGWHFTHALIQKHFHIHT